MFSRPLQRLCPKHLFSRCKAYVHTQRHVPVLLEEALHQIRSASENKEGTRLFCDATFGDGGYTKKLLDRLDCKVVAIDQDPLAYERAVDLANSAAYRDRIIPIQGKFGDLVSLLQHNVNLHGPCLDGILFDIGVSSNQLDEAGRGFSFKKDGPLDMRMASRGDSDNSTRDLQKTVTAEVIVNNFAEHHIADIIYQYGEERQSRRIARAIATARGKAPIKTTKQLADIVSSAVGGRWGAGADGFKHPAVRTFQGLRVYINDELNQLRLGLKSAELLLKPTSPLVCITFHSLEDRILKQFLRKCSAPQSVGVPHQSTTVDAGELDDLDMDMLNRPGLRMGRDDEKARVRAKRERKRKKGGGPGDMWEHEDSENGPFLPSFHVVTKRAVKPTREEVQSNPRARSAKLRAAIRTAHPPMFPLNMEDASGHALW
ncbi:S-adenosyl-methyltransferase MraW [Spizellomyces punctatus DAOM BR117]|uniref:S-adenosyl-methyltransferase MraW n=1 Tax=Spizellomyces punctatus (strain DAOM BR117) TaxID=645134 RepID=A0A0L0HMQ4_SPIPD|nr:S-adenosyl-methyltransferase MraW [Spizellomyces punctatus DAOM BR117]KND02711.1 S-adenosyl-methyltransferase MraW [Spizellomyces punctatus DAOM BR117]|eukprot:XP_016610750.1 S-adenosyl-methyltransferase MraW [Spizellomyces punctatus DAOM BR117]